MQIPNKKNQAIEFIKFDPNNYVYLNYNLKKDPDILSLIIGKIPKWKFDHHFKVLEQLKVFNLHPELINFFERKELDPVIQEKYDGLLLLSEINL